MFAHNDENELLSIEQLYDRLFISSTTAYKLLKLGEIKGFKLVAKEQILVAFDQAEKELTDLRQKTREGIETPRVIDIDGSLESMQNNELTF